MSMEKRKIKLINRDFQYKLMGKFIIINAFILTFFGGIIYIFFKSEISANLASAHASYKSVAQMLLPIIITLSSLAIILTSIIIIMVILNASHKIAGPIFRFNDAIKEIEGRNLNPYTSLRSDDQLKDVADSFSRMTDILSTDFSRMKKLIDNISINIVDPKVKDKADELNQLISNYKFR